MKRKNLMIYGPTTTACTPNHLIPIELGLEKKIQDFNLFVYFCLDQVNYKRKKSELQNEKNNIKLNYFRMNSKQPMNK